MKRKSMIWATALFALSGPVLADDSEPPLDASPQNAAMRYCLTEGVRAAWGAQARFLGAPATFKYVPERFLKKMFYGEASDIPTDAIYVLDEMGIDDRRAYEEAAFYGWKQADRWVREGRERQDYEVLSAVFYQGCKDELTSGPRTDSAIEPRSEMQ